MSDTIALKPRLNEKTYGLATSRVYVFDVERSLNKHSIARAVESQFEVKVTQVRTTNISGKPKRVISLNGKRVKYGDGGSRNDFKKAYVTLAEGNALPFFDAIEEEEQKEQKVQEQFEKAAAKQAKKDDKAAAKSKKSDQPEEPTKSDQPAEAKKSAANKPATKTSKPAAQSDEKPAEPAAAEEPKKHGLAAWRGFRLRKKDRGDK